MSANIEVETFVVDSARDAAYVDRIRLKHDYRLLLFRQFVGRGQTGWPGTNDDGLVQLFLHGESAFGGSWVYASVVCNFGFLETTLMRHPLALTLCQ